MAISPNVVTVWEAVVTTLCFPLLVIVAWVVDTRKCCGGTVETLDADAGYVISNAHILIHNHPE